MSKFITPWTFVGCVQSLFDANEIVETAGYVPRQKTIENLLLCGQRLVESRMEEFDGRTVEEALENASICRVNNLDLAESVSVLAKLSDEAERSKVDAGSGISMPVEKSNNSESETSELSKDA